MSHTRIVEVEVIETVTRRAHLQVTSQQPITDERVAASGDLYDKLIERAQEIGSETDSGWDHDQESIVLIPVENEDRYEHTIDDSLDPDDLGED